MKVTEFFGQQFRPVKHVVAVETVTSDDAHGPHLKFMDMEDQTEPVSGMICSFNTEELIAIHVWSTEVLLNALKRVK